MVVIENGQVHQPNLRKLRMSVDVVSQHA
ncbi:hypothetical protein [Cohnella sp. CFH 77786]